MDNLVKKLEKDFEYLINESSFNFTTKRWKISDYDSIKDIIEDFNKVFEKYNLKENFLQSQLNRDLKSQFKIDFKALFDKNLTNYIENIIVEPIKTSLTRERYSSYTRLDITIFSKDTDKKLFTVVVSLFPTVCGTVYLKTNFYKNSKINTEQRSEILKLLYIYFGKLISALKFTQFIYIVPLDLYPIIKEKLSKYFKCFYLPRSSTLEKTEESYIDSKGNMFLYNYLQNVMTVKDEVYISINYKSKYLNKYIEQFNETISEKYGKDFYKNLWIETLL